MKEAAFTETVNDDHFEELLLAAQANPTGEEAREVLRKVLRFINLSGSVVPWGNLERKSEITKLMAGCRFDGPNSLFFKEPKAGGDEALSKAGAAAAKSLNAKAARARGTTSTVDRLRYAGKVSEFTKGLGAALASWGGAGAPEAPAAGPELQRAWAGAANPAMRTLTPSMHDPKELTKLLKMPLPVRELGEASDKMDEVEEGVGAGTGGGPIGGDGALDSNGRYAEISEDEFDDARAEEGINYLEVVEVNRRNTTLHTHARITLPQCEAPAP